MNNLVNFLQEEIVIDEVIGQNVNAIENAVAFFPGHPDIFNVFAEMIAVVENNNNLHEYVRNFYIRIGNYYENVIPLYSNSQFYSHFRMSRETFTELENIVGERVEDLDDEIPLRKKLLLTIWVLATPESFRSVADRFNLAKSTTHRVFKEIVSILTDLMPSYIKWPNRNVLEESVAEFRERSGGFPGIVGVIDGCHIKIKQPRNNSIDYYNRKGDHSVILQGTCDHNCLFIDVLIGRPGRLHDATVFRSSRLYERIMDANNPLLPPNRHIIGDSAYPLLQNLMKPFRDDGHLTAAQVSYNRKLASTRSIIERVFGFLKNKFRRLFYLDVGSVYMAELIIAASCMLHNFLLIHGDINIHNFNYNHDDGDDNNNDDNDNENEDDGNNDARQKRITIMNQL